MPIALSETSQIYEHLSKKDQQAFSALLQRLRDGLGTYWGMMIDVRDDLTRILRCIFCDTVESHLKPVMNVPLDSRISWRIEAFNKKTPTYFQRLDPAEPRSFYLRKALGNQQMAMFPLLADSPIGLVTLFTVRETNKTLSPADLEYIQDQVQELIPIIENIIWQLEQDRLKAATRVFRQNEIPIVITDLFQRLLTAPVFFLEHIDQNNYRCLQQAGLPSATSDQRQWLFEIKQAQTQPLTRYIKWKDISNDPNPVPENENLTLIQMSGQRFQLLVMRDVDLEHADFEHIDYFISDARQLLEKAPYQISNLTFLLQLQHWIRRRNHDIDEVFQFIVDQLVPFLDADFGLLALLDRERRKLLFVKDIGGIHNPLKSLDLEDSQKTPTSIMGWVAREGRPYISRDVTTDRFYRTINPNIRSEMCVPIRVRGDVIGFFSVSSRQEGHFDTEALSKLEFYADQIAIALLQAGLLDKAFHESPQARKLDQEYRFGFHVRTHAKDIDYAFGNLVGSEKGAMGKVYQQIQRINSSGRDDLNVLITGETGTGKEMVAAALHNSSKRGKNPMVVTNFASLGGDPNLIQSELFGHERGSFSGATHRRIGCIESANKTSLLIDEIGDVVSSVQIKLLRVLQQGAVKRFQRLGGQDTITSDVRILAATHQNLMQKVHAGEFREDLYYRLSTLVIRIPALRERIEDIPFLARHFISKYRQQAPDIPVTITDSGTYELQQYHWPGNVRQLEGVINRGLVMFSEDGVLDREAVRASLALEVPHDSNPQSKSITYKEVNKAGPEAFWKLVQQPYRERSLTRDELRNLISDALQATRGSYKQAALNMGIDEKDYRRFLDFLKNSDAKLDFRAFR